VVNISVVLLISLFLSRHSCASDLFPRLKLDMSADAPGANDTEFSSATGVILPCTAHIFS